MTVRLDRRPADALMGRFGGGWEWKLGVQASRLTRAHGTIIVSLVTFSVRISWER